MISYPYEWGFNTLKKAAIFHLDFHLKLLSEGYNLSDATAYNVQFIGSNPVFIDLLSIRKYQQGEYWLGHRQFCEQFLFPLLLRSIKGIPHNSWYRGNLEGIPLLEFYKVLPKTSLFSMNMLFHVIMQAKLQQKVINDGSINGSSSKVKEKAKITLKPLPIASFKQMLQGLRKWITALTPKDMGESSVWKNYHIENTYDIKSTEVKRTFIAEFIQLKKPKMLWDFGCNVGDYSALSLKHGADYVVGFDIDQNALDLANSRAEVEKLPFQALYFDAANTSPSQGWGQNERKGLLERGNADVIIALAFIHHLAIGRNIPLDKIIDWMLSFAKAGIIEFVAKEDPTAQILLQNREDIFPDYNEDFFVEYLSAKAEILKSTKIPDSCRTIYAYQVKN
ncbi:MAG: class I SAM-dependent methyltransferase [Pseudomonadales bacterium]|nr:class I SAM-dependent methyltransferase [Pseudomonadales bacterium]